MTPSRRVSVAIDGPAGSGKSTVAREVALRVGYIFVDSGAMYRAVAFRALERDLQPGCDDEALGRLAGEMQFDFRLVEGVPHLFESGEDLEAAIRSPEVGNLSSPVSAIPAVRQHLLAAQRQMAGGGGVVMEGRDIGTVVLPRAEVKVFLTASDQERARRRRRQLQEQGVERSLEQILQEQRERDRRDSTRAVAPLRQARDAYLLVTDGMSFEQVVTTVVGLVRQAEAAGGGNPR